MAEQTINARLARELSLGAAQIERTVALLDEGNTIPFITRYRKESPAGWMRSNCASWPSGSSICATWRRAAPNTQGAGGWRPPDAGAGRAACRRRNLAGDRGYLFTVPAQAPHPRPGGARAGLQPLADALLAQDAGGKTAALAEALSIPKRAWPISRPPMPARAISWPRRSPRRRRCARPCARPCAAPAWRWCARTKPPTPRANTGCHEFGEALATLPHRILAINRGEREGAAEGRGRGRAAFVATLQRRYAPAGLPVADEVRAAVADGYKRLLAPRSSATCAAT